MIDTNNKMEPLTFSPLLPKDLMELVLFCDQEIGKGYYKLQDLEKALNKVGQGPQVASFIVRNLGGEIVALRLSYIPGSWVQEYSRKVSPDLWTVPSQQVAYFKSLFINKRYQQCGLGSQLSQMSIAVLKQLGAKAIVCHSAMQSPQDSSQRYLKKMGFEALRLYQHFWSDVDYECTHCGKRPCQCSAMEMILHLSD